MSVRIDGSEILKQARLSIIPYLGRFRNVDIEDLKQEVAIKLSRYAPRTLDSELHKAKWLSLFGKRFTINAVRDFYARQRRKPTIYYGIGESTLESYCAQQFTADNNLQSVIDTVSVCFASLPPKYKKIILEKMTYKNVSKVASKHNASRRNIHHIVRKLRLRINEDQDL